jgi:hypothetical protein
MKKIFTKLAGVVCGLLLSLTAWSDAPPGVGSADVSTGACIGTVTVGPPGDFTPFLDGVIGVMYIQLGDSQTVVSNSANGNRNLSCHGKVLPGDVVVGIDIISGDIVSGTVTTRSDACSALVAFGLPNPCRGKGEKSAIVFGPEFNNGVCDIDGVLTSDWKSVFNEGGYMLTCHSKE